jgi:hypothetical protein
MACGGARANADREKQHHHWQRGPGGSTVGLMAVGEREDLFAIAAGLDAAAGFATHYWKYTYLNLTGRGIGKGLLSILLRGGLAFGLCATSSECFSARIRRDAAIRFAIGLAIGDVIDDILLARLRLSREDLENVPIIPVAWATPQGGSVGLMARW